jgi:rSAM/selenodomain-associated transferase 1
VFAKAPVPGFAKTRLIPLLGKQGAARLQAELIRHTLGTCYAADAGPVELWCTPDTEHPFFQQCRLEYGVKLHGQCGGELGGRMYSALKSALRRGRTAVLLGTDIPGLTSGDLHGATRALSTGADAVIAPAHDGGYVLIGLTRVRSGLFRGIEWGTDRVLAQTRRRLQEFHYRWQELPTQRDIDRPEDWLGLLAKSPEWARCLDTSK